MDVNGRVQVAKLMIVRGDPHPKLKHHFTYHYQADYAPPGDTSYTHRYIGDVLHNYNNGAFALVNKVTKAILKQQKTAKPIEVKGED